MNLDVQEQTNPLFLLSFFVSVCVKLTFLCAVLLLDTLNINKCSQLYSSTLLIIVWGTHFFFFLFVSLKDIAKIGKRMELFLCL